MFQYMHYLFNETEIRFYKKYKLFPDELFQQLQNLGFSRESFKPIQKEMDRLFLLQKEESTWTKADCDPFLRVTYLTIATLLRHFVKKI